MVKIFNQVNVLILFVLAFYGFDVFAFQDSAINIILEEKVDLTCPGETTGEISVTVNGGSGSLSYKWSGPESFSADTQDLSGLGEGTYTLVVTDSASPTPGTASATYTINQSDLVDPVLSAPAEINRYTDPGKCTASGFSLGSPSASDNCAISSTTHDAPEVFSLGTTTITWRVTDASGNTATATQKVPITDSEEPQITSPSELFIQTDPFGCTASNVVLGTPVTSDNCEINSLVNNAPSEFPIGVTTVIWTITDASGNTASANQKVTVKDAEAPEIQISQNVVVDTDIDKCTASNVDLGNHSFTDNCGGVKTENDAPTTFPIGVTTVTWTATDEAGNSTTATQTVTVEDNQAPTITAPANLTLNADSGKCTASANLGTPVTNENCSGATVKNNAPANFPLGITKVTWTITDASGNTATAEQTVTVIDAEKPAITPPSNVSTMADPNSCTASGVVLGNPVVTDNCTGVTFSSDAPSSFPLGNTTVTWTATDAVGNKATAVQIVTIQDKQAPLIQVADDIEVFNKPGSCGATVTVPVPGVTDNCEAGSPTATRNDGKPLDAIFPVGTTVISWNITDSNGNKAVPVSQNIIVIDNEAPVAPVLNNITWGCEYTLSVPSTTDNCSGTITGTTEDPLTYSTPGTHIISWNFTDSNGNTSSVDQKLIIKPVTAVTQINPVLCNGFSTGSVTVMASGGVAPYTYTWETLGNGATKNNLAAGSYRVTVSDVNGCQMEPFDVVISEPDSFIEITEIDYNVGCFGKDDASATALVTGGSGSYTYLWSNGQTTKTAEGLSPGQHSVTVTDKNGCTATKSVNIEAADELVITGFSTTETTSFDTPTGMATVNISGGTAPFQFEWSNNQTGQIARNLRAGSYSVTVTDANGCSVTGSVTIIDSIEGIIVPSSLCMTEEGGIRVSTFKPENVRGGTGPYTYSWNFGEGATPSSGTGAGPHVVEYSFTGDKVITMTITDATGLSHTETVIQYVGECFEVCGNTSNFDIDLDTFYIGKEDGTRLTSSDCSYTGKKYIFLKSTTNANAYSPTVEYIYTLRDLNNGGAVVGTYTVISCLAEYDNTANRYKMIPELLNLGEVAEWSCGYSITMENFFMSWTNNFKRGCGENPKMMCLSTNEKDEIIYPLYASIKTTDLLCFGSSSGTLTVTASGGKSPYTYSLNGGAYVTNNVFRDLDGGTYTVTVKDADGQIYEAVPNEILEPADPLQIKKPVVNTPVTCFGGSDGSATVEVSGGSPFTTGNPYIYVWSNGQTTPTATGLSAGEYSVTIIDANGCELTETISIAEPPYEPANAGNDIVLPCGTNYTSIGTHLAEGATGTWEVINGPAGWELAETNAAVTTFKGNIGTYTLRWTVSCGASDDVKITIGDCNTIDFDGVDDHIDFGNTFSLGGEFTLEAWIKPKSVTGKRTVLSKRSAANYAASGYELVLENGFPTFNWNGGSVASPVAIGTNRWYHLNVSSGSEGTKLYIDGIEIASGNLANPSANSTSFIVGGLTEGTTAYATRDNFHGWIEEVRIWNSTLTTEQLRFMMNQRLVDNGGMVKGKEIPFNVPGGLSWSSLTGYYHMEIIESGYTLGQTPTSVKGKLRNITTLQQRSAPLPYVSKRNGNWNDINTASTPWLYGQGIWDAPNSLGVNKDSINWNIVRTSHGIKSGKQDITLLGLLSEKGKLSITDAGKTQNEYNPGHSLRITHYLDLDGVVDLVGESQLVQDEGSILEENSSGYIERDQQGTASSYNYNYWSSPVSPTGSSNNSPYTVETVLRDGTNSANPIPLVFNYQYHFADWAYSGAKRISTFWLHVFTNRISNTYSQWQKVKENGGINTGEGYSMKGTSGAAAISDQQNYVFVGKPHNGEITLKLDVGNDYLVGNPYPSAIDGYQFILDNIKESGGTGSHNVFNGTLYFWDHFSGKSHYLQEYVGGYATLNLSGGIEAVATDARINATGERADIKPEQFIPVGQAFYVSTKLAPELENLTTVSGGNILFRNSQRVFETDNQPDDNSVFKSQENVKSQNKTSDLRQKIYLHYRSPEGYHRQLLVTRDSYTTTGFDLGYDAPMIENNKEDMYWMISDVRFVIQGVPDFDQSRELPIGFRVKEEGEILIEIDKLLNIPDELEIYLKDNSTGETYDLRAAAFKGIAVAGPTEGRYSLVFDKKNETEEETTEEGPGEEESTEEGAEEGTEEPAPGETEEETDGEETGVDIGQEPQAPVTLDLSLSYSTRDSEIIIQNPGGFELSKGTLYNVLGQVMAEFPNLPADPVVVVPIGSRAPGVYLFKVESSGRSKSVRFILE